MKNLKFIKSSLFIGTQVLEWEQVTPGARSIGKNFGKGIAATINSGQPMTRMEVETFNDMIARKVHRTSTCSHDYKIEGTFED